MSGSVKHLLVVKKVLQWQFFLALFAVICSYLVHRSMNDVYSSLLGALIAILPTVAYIRIAFKKGLVTSPAKALVRHQKAFFVRLGLNLMLFLLAFWLYKNCNFLILLLSYSVVLGAYWLSLVKTSV